MKPHFGTEEYQKLFASCFEDLHAALTGSRAIVRSLDCCIFEVEYHNKMHNFFLDTLTNQRLAEVGHKSAAEGEAYCMFHSHSHPRRFSTLATVSMEIDGKQHSFPCLHGFTLKIDEIARDSEATYGHEEDGSLFGGNQTEAEHSCIVFAAHEIRHELQIYHQLFDMLRPRTKVCAINNNIPKKHHRGMKTYRQTIVRTVEEMAHVHGRKSITFKRERDAYLTQFKALCVWLSTARQSRANRFAALAKVLLSSE